VRSRSGGRRCIEYWHLFEALSIIKEIKDDGGLMAAVRGADSKTQESFATSLNSNVVAFHYEPKLSVWRLRDFVDKSPSHSMTYALGGATLDWYFELGDLIADEIVIRDVFQIPASANLEEATTEVLDRLRTIGIAFIAFAGICQIVLCAITLYPPIVLLTWCDDTDRRSFAQCWEEHHSE
jgi:hypothetical protein